MSKAMSRVEEWTHPQLAAVLVKLEISQELELAVRFGEPELDLFSRRRHGQSSSTRYFSKMSDPR
jgi:hypothetical protein